MNTFVQTIVKRDGVFIIHTRVLCAEHITKLNSDSVLMHTTSPDPCEVCEDEARFATDRWEDVQTRAIYNGLLKLVTTNIFDIKVYIAGPMSGYKDNNIPAFMRMEAFLKRHGFTVNNPATLLQTHSYEWLLQNAMKMLLNSSVAVFLHRWKFSYGASLENKIATAIRMPIFYEKKTIGI